jgi:hypothetical protein
VDKQLEVGDVAKRLKGLLRKEEGSKEMVDVQQNSHEKEDVIETI